MIIEKNQIFNLMDTNGRRSDVLNALKIYLEILEELKEDYPQEKWGTYPNSLAQFLFYEKAIDKSKDVFKVHSKYDKFISELGNDYQTFIEKDDNWIKDNITKYSKIIDESIEKRSRHYTSNLVKIGFTSSNRNITEAGYSYLKGNITRDVIEELLPLDSINIALLRQLAKLRIFSTPDDEGNRKYYSPFLMAVKLLLNDEPIDKRTFEVIVQGLTPYIDDSIKEAILNNQINISELEKSIQEIPIDIPDSLISEDKIEFDLFKKFFYSSKNNESTSKIYYDFYTNLNNFREENSEENYAALINCFDDNSAILNKAFGFGKSVFNIGNKGSRFELKKFIDKNSEHLLLTTESYIVELYKTFIKSKWIDGIREYSDTTMRLLSATGLFKFKNLPELSYADVLSVIFDPKIMSMDIFGEMSQSEFFEYEIMEDCYYGKNTPLCDIYNFSEENVSDIYQTLIERFGVKNISEVSSLLIDSKNLNFISHINEKYPKEKIIELLPLFSDRTKDKTIKREVNDSATVPTIYEYIIGIAWYYISNKEFDLYNSLNLTLNADFDPVFHAGGGEGDIVISYQDLILMLEVTLMNKQAQKRGEWEPVLRHSLNLKAQYAPKETLTFFIADELDFNTINIWRAVAAVPLESTNNHTKVDNVVIMPFTNKEILYFLTNNISHHTIIENVKSSFAGISKITDSKWRESIIETLQV